MECRWTTRWLNHSAGGNWAENVARATGGADRPRCLRPLLLNRRDNSDIFSEIQEAKCGNQIAWQTNNFCRSQQWLCLRPAATQRQTISSVSSSHPFLSFLPLSYLLPSLLPYYFQSLSFVHLITITVPSFNAVPFYKTHTQSLRYSFYPSDGTVLSTAITKLTDCLTDWPTDWLTN